MPILPGGLSDSKSASVIGTLVFVLASAFAGALVGLLYDLYTVIGTVEVDSDFTVQRGGVGALIGAAAAVVIIAVGRARQNRL